MNTAKRAWRILWMVIAIAMTSSAARAQDPAPAQDQASSAKPQPTNKYVVRGCLNRSTLTDIEPTSSPLKLPEKLRVTHTRTIRDQVKGLSGHQVELTGALFGVPGVQQGILIGDSGTVRVYIGGGDPSLGQDLAVSQNDPPTIRATTIKDIAPSCAGR